MITDGLHMMTIGTRISATFAMVVVLAAVQSVQTVRLMCNYTCRNMPDYHFKFNRDGRYLCPLDLPDPRAGTFLCPYPGSDPGECK